MFLVKLKVEHAKVIFRKHHTSRNAHLVWTELVKYMSRSTKAKISASADMKYLTSARYHYGEWPGTAQSFIDKMIETLRKYNDRADAASRLTDHHAWSMLRCSVEEQAELASVWDHHEFEVLAGNAGLTYASYQTLLLGVCAGFDRSKPPKTAATRSPVSWSRSTL